MLRRATDDDWRAVIGTEPPAHWVGLVEDDNGRLDGIGGVWFMAGRWWASLHRRDGVRKPVTMHRAALETIATARAAGVAVHAMCDETIPGAALWLQRLGFERTDEAINEVPIWVLT